MKFTRGNLSASLLCGLCRLAREPRRIVGKIRCEPLFALPDRPALALGVVLDLIAVDAADAEIGAFGMREINARDRRARPHRVALGDRNPDLRLGAEERKQRDLLGVLGLLRVAGRRPNADKYLLD